MTEDWKFGGFGLYVHWPFCQSKCPYCDFNSHVSDAVDQDRWARAFESEIDRVAAQTPDRLLSSVFFGGGTPSLMDPKTVERILTKAHDSWPQANDIEITLEANPGSVEANKFHAFRQAGVNRVSLGVQSLNQDDLRALGRLHSVDEALAALDIARTTFDRVSFDLIYARQNQTLSNWETELSRAISFDPDHLSLYQLTIEDGTAFGARFAAGKLKGLPTEDLAADMYEATQSLCSHSGLSAYEVSNHAKTGSESRHNMIYWKSGDYAGVGPGAHGRLTTNGRRTATATHMMPNSWLEAVEATGSGQLSDESLSVPDRLTEFLVMGLRVSDGIDIERLTSWAPEAVELPWESLIASGFIEAKGPNLRLTDRGRPLLNAVLRELLAA